MPHRGCPLPIDGSSHRSRLFDLNCKAGGRALAGQLIFLSNQHQRITCPAPSAIEKRDGHSWLCNPPESGAWWSQCSSAMNIREFLFWPSRNSMWRSCDSHFSDRRIPPQSPTKQNHLSIFLIVASWSVTSMVCRKITSAGRASRNLPAALPTTNVYLEGTTPIRRQVAAGRASQQRCAWTTPTQRWRWEKDRFGTRYKWLRAYGWERIGWHWYRMARPVVAAGGSHTN